MGWSRGTEIFDKMCDELLETSYCWTGSTDAEYISDSIVLQPLKILIGLLKLEDWDCQCESDYWEHPVIGKLLGNDFEGDE